MRINKTTTKPKVATVWLDAADLEAWQTPEGRARIETQADRLVALDKCKRVRVYAPNGIQLLDIECMY